MSIRSLNGLNATNVYVNSMFNSGEATEVIQTSNTTQASVNISMKENTTEATSISDTDLILVGDTTGKIIKYITGANIKNEGTHWTLNSNDLRPDNTSYNILIGTTTNTSSRKLNVNGTAEISGVLTLGSTINSLTLPTGTKTLATLTGTENFTNKTLGSNCAWNGGTIGVAYGGTGFVGIGKGEMFVGDATPTLSKLLKGTNGYILKMVADMPTWSADTNYFTKSGSNVNLTNLSENLLIGTSSNSVSAKLNVVGNTQLNGTLKNSFTGLYSFSFINNSFYNDANRTIHLEQDSGTYGYNHTAYDATPATYSDVATYCSSTGTAISAIGSRNNNRFGLYADENWFMIASPANRNYVCLGQATRFNSGITPLTALHIENAVSDLSAHDTTILVKSNSSTYDSRISFSVNSATDGTGSAQETYIDANSSKNLKFTATDISMFLFGGSEKFRFTGGSLQAIGTNLISTRTPPSSQSNTAEANIRLSGGNGTSTATGWATNDGTRYYMLNFVPPYHTGGPWGFWTEDTGASYFGLSYGSNFLWYADSSNNLVGASTWTGSDQRIKEEIVNADTQECINIIKRLPLKQYKYKEVLRDKCSGFTQSKVFGWIAQDIKADPVMNYASKITENTKYYDKETNSILEYEVEDMEIINKPSLNAVSWGAISGLINIVEQQQAIIDKLTSASSFKAFRDSL